MVGLYILVSLSALISLSGCVRGVYREEYRADRHYYRDGHWYRHDARGHEVTVADLVIGAIAESLPPQHTTVVVQGDSYYHDGNHYYKPARSGGYVVVPAPVIVQQQSQGKDNREKEREDNHSEGNRGQNR